MPRYDSTKEFTNYKSSSIDRIHLDQYTDKRSDCRSQSTKSDASCSSSTLVRRIETILCSAFQIHKNEKPELIAAVAR